MAAARRPRSPALLLLFIVSAAPALAARLTRAQLANAALSKAQLRASLAARAAAAPPPPASSAPLWPPFTPCPPLSVRDIDGGVASFPVPGAPLVAFAYNASDAWAAASWASSLVATETARFLTDSSFGAPSANLTRFLFASFNESAGGAAADAAMMRARLEAAMDALGWPDANRSDWLSRATFAADPVSSLGDGGWVAQLLANWTDLGGVHGATLSLEGGESGEHVTVPRLDADFAWLPPPPARGAAPSAAIYGGNSAAVAASTTGGTAPAGAAVLVTCGFSFDGGAAAGARCDGDFDAIVRGVEALGGAFAVVVLPAGAEPVLMDGDSDDASPPPGIAATLVAYEHGLALWRAMGSPAPLARSSSRLSLSLEDGKSGCTFSVSAGGALLESGWFGRPGLRFLSFAAQWLDFERRTQANITAGAAAGAEDVAPSTTTTTTVVSVFNYSLMLGYPGASAVVAVPAAAAGAPWTRLEVDFALGCPTPWETSCAIWDRQQQVLVCCSNTTDPTCGGANFELARAITPFRRGLGRWVTDVSPLLPLIFGEQTGGGGGAAVAAPAQCLFTAATDAWAMPWTVTLNLRLSAEPPAPPARRPRLVAPLWNTGAGGNGGANWGATFDQHYNNGVNFPPRSVAIPSWATRATLYSVITGHGSDNFNCAEFCVTTHEITVGGAVHSETFDNAGTDEGCAYETLNGALPNEHGTWL